MKALLCLTALYFVVLNRCIAQLRPGGRNVRTRYVSTSVALQRDTLTYYLTQTCSVKCQYWGCCPCRKCNLVAKLRRRTVTYYTTRYIPQYYCPSDWRQSGHECTIPICTGGCANGGTCIYPRQCKCMQGWQGTRCLTDVNECVTNNGGCQQHCSNSRGSYSCYCDPGYRKSGFSNCQDINECNGAHNCQQKCVNKPGSYSCACYAGYKLDNNGTTCSDIDECLQPMCQHKCKNTDGSFLCTCPRGYLLTSNKRDCADHDECITGNHKCGQRCVNHPGGYTCTCHAGFFLNKDNQTCSDIDECKLNLAGCAYQCNNTIGSFQCTCSTGYVLNADNRTCSDHDECRNDQHACSQICGNTPGSYYCACRPGYYLDGDFRTCKGYQCSSISRPAKGYINCSGNTVDSVCQFRCQPGYELVGSQLRTCLANSQWSGDRAVCKIKHCNWPTSPVNGYVNVLLPCSTTYQGECSFVCGPGYFLNGSRTSTCSADSKWIPIPGECDAITVCHPNPCFHGGTCHPVNSTVFRCNCSNTAYVGYQCNVGILRSPKYPQLHENSSMTVTFELSPPENELIITPKSTGLEFRPRSLLIDPVQSLEQGKLYVANMTVTARFPGIHLITYTLSGVAAKTYQAVLPDAVIVLENGTSCNFTSVTKFPVGCQKVKLFECPKINDSLYAVSTESWKRSERQVSTKGIASLLSGNLTLPLGIQGATLDKMNYSSIETDIGQCQNQSPKDMQCLQSETLASVFLQSINESFPRWFRLIPSKTLSSLQPTDIITYIWSGAELKGILKGLGLSVNDSSYYSVLLYTGAMTVEVNGSSVELPIYGQNSFALIAVELCSHDRPAKVVLAFNPLSYNALQSMQVYRKLSNLGWNVSALAMQFSNQSALSYLANVGHQGNTSTLGNLEFFGSVEKSIDGSHPIHSFKARLVGNAITEIKYSNKAWIDNHNSWTAGLRGQVTISMKLSLLGQQLSLKIPLEKCSGQLQYQDSEQNRTCNFQDAYALFLNGRMQRDPFTSTLLGSFIESTDSNILTFFAKAHNVNASTSTMHLGFHLKGTLKFGSLKFPNVNIKSEVYSKDYKTCNGNRNFEGLKLSATFNQQNVLGSFFTSSNWDSLQISLPSNSPNRSEGILNTSVTLLGDSFPAQVLISNTSLSFKSDFHLFNTYQLSVSGSSKLQPWDVLLLKVTGVFGRSDLVSGHGTLEYALKAMIKDFIIVVSENTSHRLRTLKNADDKINARIDKNKLRLDQAENNTQLAIRRYLWALKAQQAALKEVNNTAKKVSNITQEVNNLIASFERLCTVSKCPYVCLTGTDCNTCYKDLISREQGLCPGTCHKVLKQRLPPYTENTGCVEQKCKQSGSIDSESFIGCNLDHVGKSLLQETAKIAVTAGLQGIGVPPIVGYPIASGAVTYASTGSEEEALKSVATSAVMKAISGSKSSKSSGSKIPGAGSSDSISRNYGSAAFFGFVNGDKECRGKWECGIVHEWCKKNVFNYKFINVPYSCKVSCEVNVIKETVAYPCCRKVNCATRIRDLKCKEKNSFCRIAMEKAMSKLSVAKSNLLKPFVQLQQAKKKLRVVEIELAKQTIELEAATSERNTIRRVYESLVKAGNISQMANDKNRALIKDSIALAQLWNSSNQTCPVEIKTISFDVKLSSPSETRIPVLFKVASENTEKTIFPTFDFASLNESLQKTAKIIVHELFGNVSTVLRSGHPLNQVSSARRERRRKRSIYEGDSEVNNLLEFKRKCALVRNYQNALGDIIGSLFKISTDALLTLNDAANHTTKYRHAKAHDFAINLTQAVELGLSDKDIDDSINAVSADEEVLSMASLIELRNATNYNKLQTAISIVFLDWEASMERVFNFTSLECNGFVDCIEDFVGNLLYLYQEVELPEAAPLKSKLTLLSTEVKSLVSLEDVSVPEATAKSYKILQILRDIKNENIFCAIAPNITTHPVVMKEMKIGQTLELHCKATGDPAPSYRWRKNGALLPGQNKENLRIVNMTTGDGGNYTCEAYNHVSVESSTPSNVVVHSPPGLVYQPPNKLNIPINTYFYIRCNATSTARPLRYQWLFMPFSGNRYTLVPNGNFSALKFASAQKHEEGFYKCNVSNPFGFTVSQSVLVRVLSFSLAVPSFRLSFELVGDKNSLNASFEESNKVGNDGSLLRVKEHFQLDVQLSFTTAVHNLVNLSSNAVQNLAIEECKIKDDVNNISCRVSFRLHSINVTGPESTNKIEKENALNVIESVKQLQQSVAVLVNESAIRGIVLNVKDANLTVDPGSWKAGDYRSICPIGTVLYVDNFFCVNCPPGTRGNFNGSLPACFPCPVGTYQPDQGQTSCIPCPSGSTSRRPGLENRSSCKAITTSLPRQSTQSSRFTDFVKETIPTTAVETTPKETVATTPKEEAGTTPKLEVEKKLTEKPEALSFGSDKDVAAKWKVALGICVAIIIILLAVPQWLSGGLRGVVGCLLYTKLVSVMGMTFYMYPITTVVLNVTMQAVLLSLISGVLVYAIHWRNILARIRHFKTTEKRTTANGQTFQNPIYDVNEDVKQSPLYSIENPVYELEDPPALSKDVKQGPLHSHENPAYQLEVPRE